MQQNKRTTPMARGSSETISSGPMAAELRRWRSAPIARPFAHRWIDWAQSMIGRHRTIAARYVSQPMTVVHQQAQIELKERLLSFSFNVYSRINLAIQPLLREISGSGDKRQSQSIQAIQEGGDGNTTFAVPVNWSAGVERGSFEPFTSAGIDRSSPRHLANVADGSPSMRRAGMATGAIEVKEPLPRGLALVFRRLHQLADSTDAKGRPRVVCDEEIALGLARKVQRVEQAVREAQIGVVRRSATRVQQVSPQVVATEHVGQNNARMFQGPYKSWPEGFQQMPEPMVEQLTEHVIREIDHRAIARRERMGKI